MTQKQSSLFSPVLIAGCIILMAGFSIRASFGVFQIPIAEEFNWLRSEFSLAIAVQNLAWGVGQPLFAAFAEKFGERLAVFLGACTYAVGLVLSSYAVTPEAHQFLEILVGFGVAGTGFGVILAVVGRAASDKNRSLTLGIATAAGSVGQIIGPPVAGYLLTSMNWSMVFLIFAAFIMVVMLVLPFLKAKDAFIAPTTASEPMMQVLKKAMFDPSFSLIFLGFFSCGFQLGFITAHFPAYVTEICAAIAPDSIMRSLGISSTSALGAASIAIIGAANVVGTIVAGALGNKYKKKFLLVYIYIARTLTSVAFIMLPMTPTTVVLFSMIMGSLWLATVPLTSGLVAHIYGLKYMGTLYGIVFFSHQLGAFLGVWLGGTLYDQFGTYDTVWWVGIGVGVLSAVIHLPVKEVPLASRLAA